MAKKSFYNYSQKMEYINSLPDARNEAALSNMVNFFVRLNSIVESKFKQEFAEYDKKRAVLAVSMLGGRTRKTVAWNLSRLKKYLDWCIENGKTTRTENVLRHVSADEIDNTFIYRIELIKDPDHLHELMEVTYPDVRLKHPHNIYRLYMWLLYSGFTCTEAVEVKIDHVSLDKRTISCFDKVIPITDRMYELVKQNIEGVFYVDREGSVVTRTAQPSEYLLRHIKPTVVDRAKLFGNKISAFNVMYHETTGEMLQLSTNRIYYSGVYYRWYLREKNGEQIVERDYKVFLKDRVLKTKGAYVAELKKERLQYETWKRAFF